MKSTILKGVSIGNNVIIGANSLVHKDIPDNVVAAGNPAKVIMTIEEHYKRLKKVQLEEAAEVCTEYWKKYNQWPDKDVLRQYIWLFEDRSLNIDDNSIFSVIGKAMGNYDFTKKNFYKSSGQFENYEEFLNYLKRENEKNNNNHDIRFLE